MAKSKNTIQRCDSEILEPGEHKNSEINVNGDQNGNRGHFLPLAHFFYYLCQGAQVIKMHLLVQSYGKEK